VVAPMGEPAGSLTSDIGVITVRKGELSLIFKDEHRRLVVPVRRMGVVGQSAELGREDLPHMAGLMDEGTGDGLHATCDQS